MSRQALAVARLVASRQRLREAMASDVERGTMGSVVQRMVQRHPLLWASAAMLGGALLARMRPWRWALKPELWAAMLPSLMANLAGAPIGTWTAIIATLLREASVSGSPFATAPPAGTAAAAAHPAGAAGAPGFANGAAPPPTPPG